MLHYFPALTTFFPANTISQHFSGLKKSSPNVHNSSKVAKLPCHKSPVNPICMYSDPMWLPGTKIDQLWGGLSNKKCPRRILSGAFPRRAWRNTTVDATQVELITVQTETVMKVRGERADRQKRGSFRGEKRSRRGEQPGECTCRCLMNSVTVAHNEIFIRGGWGRGLGSAPPYHCEGEK